MREIDPASADEDELQRWQDMGVRHDGTIINKSMLNAVHLVWQYFDSSCQRTLDLIEREFGRAVVSCGYTKIMRMIQYSMKFQSQRTGQSFAVQDVLFFFCGR